jgi:hypothetical protein
MNIHRQAAIVAAMTFVLGLPPMPVMADLRGYSIELTSVETNVFRADDPRSIDLTRHRRIYIGQAGDVFDYSDQSAGGFAQHGANVAAVDAAKTMPRDRMRAWTMQGNRLQAIVRATEGFVVATIDVDPSRTSCTYQIAMQPDPSTGRVVVQRLNGHIAELVSLTIRSSSCAVKRGNIFAADQ